MIRIQTMKIQCSRQLRGSMHVRRRALKKPRLKAEHQDVHVAGPPKGDRSSRRRKSAVASTVLHHLFLSIEHHIAAQWLDEIIENVLPDACRVIDRTRFALPLVQNQSRPTDGSSDDRNRRRNISFDIDGWQRWRRRS